jgi:hypothetical protein
MVRFYNKARNSRYDVVADQSAATSGEDGRALDKHARHCWLLLVERHLTRRRFGGMLRKIVTLALPAGTPERDKFWLGDRGGRSCPRSRLDKRHFLGVAWRRVAKRTRSGAADGTMKQNWPKPLLNVAVCSKQSARLKRFTTEISGLGEPG